MMMAQKISVGVLATVGALAPLSADPFLNEISSQVVATVEHSNDIPENLKTGIIERFRRLVENGVIEESGSDDAVRPYFVTLQGVIEQVLSLKLNKSVESLTGVIHTPDPTTPLCTRGEISPELVHSSMQEDADRLYTVKARTTILRDFINQGGHLYVVHCPLENSKRTEEQLQIYQEELDHFPLNLHDRSLNCSALDPNLIGAFYLFKNQEGKLYAFAIKMTQANSPQEDGSYNLWFGEFENSPASERILTVWEAIKNDVQDPIDLPL